MKKTALLLIGLISTLALHAEPSTYAIDKSHSGVNFAIRHFFSEVDGRFNDFTGTVTYDPDNAANNTAEAVIKVSSVDTNDKKRDGHLQNEDFFEAPKFPDMTYKSTKWVKQDDGTYKVTGDLTILGKTKSIDMVVKMLGSGEMRGKTIAGFKGTTSIKRSEWGMTYGGPAVGDDVSITINIEAVKQ